MSSLSQGRGKEQRSAFLYSTYEHQHHVLRSLCLHRLHAYMPAEGAPIGM